MVQIDMGKPARCIDCPLIPETHEKRTETHACDPEYNMDEWCTDCTEYDQERHCCPRFNRVIRETVDEVKNNQWIPCSDRLPDTDDHVLCTTITKKGIRNIVRGYYYHDDSYPGGGQWSAGMNSNVIAWMPLPEPYQEATP